MDPSKQESVSRQSSILKPTKLRQPLQCVAPHPESSESSPTVKIKRRVSFAKNKHVRKFCNETEQGQVYDDTYEEHDSNSTKSNSTGGNEQPLTITVPCHDKENFPVQLFLQTDEIECKEVPVNTPNEIEDDLSQCDMEMDNTLNNPEVPNNVDYTNATVYCDDGMDMTTYVPSRIIACHNQDSNFLEDKDPMDLTENLPSVPCKNSTEHLRNQNDLRKSNAANSTDLTVAISQLLGSGGVNKLQSNQSKFSNVSFNTENRLNCSNTVPMEFTSILPSSTWIKRNSLCHSNKKDENFDNETMEFTVPVQHPIVHDNEITEKVDVLSKTNIFADKSMELTEAVPVHKILQMGVDTNKKIEPSADKITEYEAAVNAENIKINAIHNKTEIFDNKSIEITEAIPVYVEDCNRIKRKIPNSIEDDRTKIFSNKSMEMTEAISGHNKNQPSVQAKTNINIGNLPSKASTETNIVMEKSMEISDAIPTYNKIDKPSNLDTEETTEKTNIYCDQSMELTKSIPTHYKLHHMTHGNKKVFNQTVQDKTNVFHKSMEMTEAIPSKIVQNKAQLHEKTKIFADASMELTEAIPANEINPLKSKTLQHNLPEKTALFTDASMEMTEAVPLHTIYDCQKVFSQKDTPEKTTIFPNVSMEMTEAVPIHQIYNCQKAVLSEETPEKTKVFSNVSMEMTEAVPIHQIYNCQKAVRSEETPEKTKVFSNVSMEMTEAVPIHQIYNCQKAVLSEETPEKTKVFSNVSMEMTEAVPIHQIYNCQKAVRSEETPEKTTLFSNISMEMTEGICNIDQCYNKVPQQVLPDRTKVIFNDSMEMTEVVSNNIKYANTPKIAVQSSVHNAEYSNLNTIQSDALKKINNTLYDKPTGITESLSSLTAKDYKIKNIMSESQEDKTEYFANESMAMTEIISTQQNNLIDTESKEVLNKTAENKTKMFENNSMNISETTPIEQRFKEHPKISSDKSMNMNSTISLKKCITDQEEIVLKNKLMTFTNNPLDLINRISSTPASSDLDKMYLESNENLEIKKPNSSKSQIFLDNLLETNKSDLQAVRISELNKDKKIHDQFSGIDKTISENFNFYHNKSKSLSEDANLLDKPAINDRTGINSKLINTVSSHQNYPQQCESTKVFLDGSMEFTNLTPSVSSAANLSSKLDLLNNQSILSNRIDSVHNPLNVSNFNSHRDEAFHRITSDELNSLCASMNLPIQKYNNESAQNNSIPSCSNVSILRESLRNGTLFHQPSNILSMKNSTIRTPAKNYEASNGKDDSKMFRTMDFEMEPCRHVSRHVPTSMDMSIDYDNSRLIIPSKSLSERFTSMETEKIPEISFKGIQPLEAMETDKTSEISLKSIQKPYNSNHVFNHSSTPYSQKSFEISKQDSNKIIFSDEDALRKMPESAMLIDKYDKTHAMDISTTQPCSTSGIIALQKNIKISDSDAKTVCSIKETIVSTENKKIEAHSNYALNEKSGKVEIYHDVSMEVGAPSLCRKRKSDEMYDNVTKKNPALYLTGVTYTSAPSNKNFDKDKNDEALTENNVNENSLSRQPSDSTDVLIATMGFKTELAYPLIINDKTIIKISQKPDVNKTYTVCSSSTIDGPAIANKTYVVDANDPNNVEEKCAITNSVKNDENILQSKETSTVSSINTGLVEKVQDNDNDVHYSEITVTKSSAAADFVEQIQNVENVLKHTESPIVASSTFTIDQVEHNENRIHNFEIPVVPSPSHRNQNGISYLEIPIVNSPARTNRTEVEEDFGDEDKENQEPSAKVNLSQKYSEELEEIQPPSFLESDSLQDDDLSDIIRLPDDDPPDSLAVESNGENSNVPFFRSKDNGHLDRTLIEDQNVLPSCNLNNLSKTFSNTEKVHEVSIKDIVSCDKQTINDQKPSRKNESVEKIVEPVVCEIVEEPKSPFIQLKENMETFEKRDDCIWSIRVIKPNLIAVDFMTNSLVFVIRLNEAENISCAESIEKLEIISRLSNQSKNVSIKIVHNILLFKLKPCELIEKYKTFNDVLSLLEYVSNEVIFAMDFMFDLEKLSALNLFNIDEKSISFTVASRKANIILKVSLILKMEFNEIGPDDVDVVCLLGDIRKNDIKHLMVNIKKDYKFLSRYIKDVKDYITIMEESMHSLKF